MERLSRLKEFFFVQSLSHGESGPSVSCKHVILRQQRKAVPVRVKLGTRFTSGDFELVTFKAG